MLCTTCDLGRTDFAATLSDSLQAAEIPADITGIDCMSGCTRPSTIAFRAQGKMAYLFGDLTAADLPDLITFARLYAASIDGSLTDARPIGALRSKAIARIPA